MTPTYSTKRIVFFSHIFASLCFVSHLFFFFWLMCVQLTLLFSVYLQPPFELRECVLIDCFFYDLIRSFWRSNYQTDIELPIITRKHPSPKFLFAVVYYRE